MKVALLVTVGLYFVLMTGFLNGLYVHKLLFPTKESRKTFVHFAEDIFDVYWLLIMWLPMTLFLAYFLSRITDGWVRIALLAVAAVLTLAVRGKTYLQSTKNFADASNGCVWSAHLSAQDKKRYAALELYTGFLLILDFLCVLFTHCLRTPMNLFCKLSSQLPALITPAAIAAFALVSYFLLNTLSKVANAKRLAQDRQNAPLFSALERILGAVMMILLIETLILYWDTAQIVPTLLEEGGYILGSLLLPTIAIVLQLVQIFFAPDVGARKMH